jgi:hypothetical protein
MGRDYSVDERKLIVKQKEMAEKLSEIVALIDTERQKR